MPDLTREIVHLTVAECWTLLGTTDVGRLAVTVRGQPEIFPVSFAVDDGTVVFRTGEGTKLATLLTSPRVAFQADGAWPDDGDASWSVVLKGRTGEVRWLSALADVTLPPFLPWLDGAGRVVRVVPHEVTGRRLPRARRPRGSDGGPEAHPGR